MENEKVTVNINGCNYEVGAGLNVLEACRSVGVEVPFFCYHPKLKVAGSCRMCLVTIGTPARDRATGELLKKEDGSPEISWMPKPAIACGTKVSQNMHVVTDSEFIKSCRESVLEFLLLNHPLDCPICDKAGECKLQEYANTFGRGESRYIENKNVKPKKVMVAGKIMMDSQRCIECSRCIRFCREFIGRSIFSFTKRGSKTEISVYPNSDNDSNYLLNVVDGCPVGALTEKAFRFKMRTWFLKVTDSICGESSAGINVRVWSRNGKIYRITPRRNDAVNDMWMTDSGRYIHYRFEAKNRMSAARIDSSPCDLGYAAERCLEILKLGKVAIVANAWQSVEEMFLMKRLADACGAKIYMISHVGADDGKLLSADRTPNMRGAFLTGLLGSYPPKDFKGLGAAIDAGEVGTVLCFREDLKDFGLEQKQLKAANIIYCGALENNISASAKICIPLRTEFEKNGSWVNRQFRIQKFNMAVQAPENTFADIDFLSFLLSELEGSHFDAPSAEDVRAEMAKSIVAMKDAVHIPASGLPLDSSQFASVDFPEEDAMHYSRQKK